MTHTDYTALIRAFGIFLVTLALSWAGVWALISWVRRTRPVKRRTLTPFQPYDPHRHHIWVDKYSTDPPLPFWPEKYHRPERTPAVTALCGNVSHDYTRVDSPVEDPAALVEQLSRKGLDPENDRDPLCLRCINILLDTEGQNNVKTQAQV